MSAEIVHLDDYRPHAMVAGATIWHLFCLACWYRWVGVVLVACLPGPFVCSRPTLGPRCACRTLATREDRQ